MEVGTQLPLPCRSSSSIGDVGTAVKEPGGGLDTKVLARGPITASWRVGWRVGLGRFGVGDLGGRGGIL